MNSIVQMNRIVQAGLIWALSLVTMACTNNPSKNDDEYRVRFKTTSGEIIVKLYNETPAHRDNFIKLVDKGFYDGVIFHRVIKDFMIQAGDPLTKNAKSGEAVGGGEVNYTLPAEFVYPAHYHKRGALAAARHGNEKNPERNSSGCQFYIVWGKKLSEEALNAEEKKIFAREEEKLFDAKVAAREEEINRYRSENNQEKLDELRDNILSEIHHELDSTQIYKFTPQQRNDYLNQGGTPHLDNEYTVFGEVVKGLDVVGKISEINTDERDRPLRDVKIISAKVIKNK